MSSLAAARADNFYHGPDYDPKKHGGLNKVGRGRIQRTAARDWVPHMGTSMISGLHGLVHVRIDLMAAWLPAPFPHGSIVGVGTII